MYLPLCPSQEHCQPQGASRLSVREWSTRRELTILLGGEACPESLEGGAPGDPDRSAILSKGGDEHGEELARKAKICKGQSRKCQNWAQLAFKRVAHQLGFHKAGF